MLVFPVSVVILNAGFAVEMMRRFIRRGRSYYVAWAAALLLGFLAAAFYLIFLGSMDQTVYFKMYYLCGGLLMAAYLGLGSVYLHAGRRIGDVVTLVLVLASVVAAGFLFSTPVEIAKLHGLSKSLGPGTSALRPGAWKVFAAILNTFGAVAVIVGALYSAWRAIGRQAPVRFVWANIF